ncbi:MAG TPA: 16S rRNA (cytidine(1402)-2'-O)-methyltransferase [Thermomicrobiales bacterium]|jgi:16S rRNA (cytidine1402-2'-O)-methyltransferase
MSNPPDLLTTHDSRLTTAHALYLVATPIGNLEDITLRALRTLREVRLVAAEDTRHTRILLQHHGIATPLISYHEHNKRLRLDRILAALDEGDVALVSDAGTPGLADPGYELVCAVQEAGRRVIPIPGASALLSAAVASGLVPGPFTFLGFPPVATSERRAVFAQLSLSTTPTILYEAPHRLLVTLEELLRACGDREVGIARELTKLHEEIRREPLSAALAHFRAAPPRGEFVLIVAGQPLTESADAASGEETLRRLLAAGLPPTAAAKEAARLSGSPRAALYALAVTLKGARSTVD